MSFTVGLTSFCFDDTGNEAPQACKTLYIGQKLAAGSAATNAAVKVRSNAEAATLFGAGSQLAYAAALHFRNDNTGVTELYAIPLEDAATGVKAEYALPITGGATTTALQYFRLQQKLYAASVTAGMTNIQVAAAIAAAVDSDVDALFTAVDDGAGVVTFEAKNAGTVGNNLKIRLNPLSGMIPPAGLTFGALTVVTAGANDPSFVTTLALSIAGCKYDCIADLTLNNANHDALAQYLDNVTGTWRCGRNLRYGHSYHAAQGTVGNMVAYYEATNKAEWTPIPVPLNYHIPAFAFPAVWATRNCMSVCKDVSRPVQLQNGILYGLEDDSSCAGVWTEQEKDMMANAGIAIWDVSNRGGEYRSTLWIEANITNWKRGAGGRSDQTWQTVQKRYQFPALAKLIDEKLYTDYNSVALANNGTRLQSGRAVTTPRTMEADLNTWLDTTAFGLVESSGNGDYFKISRDTDGKKCGEGDQNRVNVEIKPNVVDSLLHIATKIKVSVENC